MVYKWINQSLDRLIPQLCLCCGAPCNPNRLCPGCLADLPWIANACALCGIPLAINTLQATAICGDCQQVPPVFDRCHTPLRYEFPLPSLLTRFKQHRRHADGVALAELLCRHLHDSVPLLERPQCLIPVPLHPWKQRRRGFNQSELIADVVGAGLGIAVRPALLKRIKRAPPQHTLSAQARQHNLRDAFALGADCSALRHIALIDDVVTTMATVNTLAQLLKQAGVLRVDVWAIARTPRKRDG